MSQGDEILAIPATKLTAVPAYLSTLFDGYKILNLKFILYWWFFHFQIEIKNRPEQRYFLRHSNKLR